MKKISYDSNEMPNILGESIKIIKYARFIEEKSVEDYLNTLRKTKTKDVIQTIISILIETVIHYEVVKALLQSEERIKTIEEKILSQSKEIEHSVEDITLLKEAIINHLLIEKEMIKLYDSLSKDDKIHPLVREVFRLLTKSEIEHHRKLVTLLKSI